MAMHWIPFWGLSRRIPTSYASHHKETMAGITFENFQQALGYLDPQTYLAFMKGWGTHAIAHYHEEDLFYFLVKEDKKKRESSFQHS